MFTFIALILNFFIFFRVTLLVTPGSSGRHAPLLLQTSATLYLVSMLDRRVLYCKGKSIHQGISLYCYYISTSMFYTCSNGVGCNLFHICSAALCYITLYFIMLSSQRSVSGPNITSLFTVTTVCKKKQQLLLRLKYI